jgi:hypothetical protein
MATVDKREAMRRAQAALDAGRPEDALAQLWPLVDREHVLEEELRAYLRQMLQALVALRSARAATTVALFLGELDSAQRFAAGSPLDLARVFIARRQPREAALAFQQAKWLGHAAIQLEEAGDDRGARLLWEQLAEDPRLREDLYTQSLVRFNLGRACGRLKDDDASRKAIVQSMHLLEAAADGFETRGLRERAFDCFQVLLTLGRDGAFENLAEGYLNCIRILREDQLKYYVLQYYEDFQKLALERKELMAAATLFREAATFARQHGLPYARYYTQRAAETHLAAAKRGEASGAPVEMTENAYAAAIDAWSDLGAYSQVREIYGLLAMLGLPEKRRARYTRLYERLTGVPDESGPRAGLPDYLRMETAYPEIWRLDVIEWEQQGDAAEAMGEVLLDEKFHDFTRRRALLCRLHQLSDVTGRGGPELLAGLALQLGRTELYSALAPLERLYQHTDARVRVACLRAVRQLYFKRSFVLVQQGLRDADPTVRSEALAAVAQLHFGHALDPLARIYRDATDLKVRRTALASIGKVPSVEALELLVDALRHGDAEEQRIARELLTRSDHGEAVAVLKNAEAAETGAAQAELTAVLRARGAA